jgi:deoxyribonucleoside regulator
MSILSKDSLISRSVYLYYRENLNIQEISDRLGISRFRVSRYLKEAEETGMVTIQINDRDMHYDALACMLEKKYSVKRVVLVPVDRHEDNDTLRRRVGAKGAQLMQNIPSGASVGITLGRTMAYMVEALPKTTTKLAYVSELTGGLGFVLSEYPSSALASLFAKKFFSYCYQLSAPIIVSDCEIAQSLCSDNSIAKTLEMSRQCDIAICGVTPFNKDSMLTRSGVMNDRDLRSIQERGGVGSIIGRFFDKDGKELDTEFKNRAIAIKMEEFLRIPERMILAGGWNKIEAIEGVLRGQLATTIVMDDFTANELLNRE